MPVVGRGGGVGEAAAGGYRPSFAENKYRRGGSEVAVGPASLAVTVKHLKRIYREAINRLMQMSKISQTIISESY